LIKTVGFVLINHWRFYNV